MSIAAIIGFAFASPLPAAPEAIVLLESKGFVHDVVKPRDGGPSVVEEVLAELGRESGLFEPIFTRDARDLTPEALRDAKLVIFYTTGDLPLDVEALNRWVSGGGAFFGIHCATDTLKGDASFRGLIGGAFRDHPWNAGDTVTIRAVDPSHPAAGPYAPSRTFKEEVYRFRGFDPAAVSTLLELDREATPKKVEGDDDLPVAWTREQGEGRVFYTSLGHREDVWRSEHFQDHLTGAVAWLLAAESGAQTDAAAEPQTTGERPRDPWVFRSILDKNARMITIALHEDLWLAYDASNLALHQAWDGGVELKGAVYDGRHGPQPESKVEAMYLQGDPRRTWSLWRGDERIDVPLRYQGYRFEDGRVVLRGTFDLPGGGLVTVSDSPDHFAAESPEHLVLHRIVRVEGLPDGWAAALQLLTPGDMASLSLPPGVGELRKDREGSPSGTVLFAKDDGEMRVTYTFERPSPAGLPVPLDTPQD